MSKRVLIVVAALGLASLCAESPRGLVGAARAQAILPGAPNASERLADVLPDRTRHIVVKWKPTAKKSPLERVPEAAVQKVARDTGLALTYHRPMSGGADIVAIAKHVSYSEARAIARQIAAQPDVAWAEPDVLDQADSVPNDSFFDRLWHYSDPAVGARVTSAWDITTGAASVVVGVIDTGSRPHADLAANLLPGYDMISDAARAGDGDGRDADPSDEGDFVTEEEAAATGFPVRARSGWHGLHVHGTVNAVGNNSRGIAGVAYGARSFHVRVLGKSGGTRSDIADGLRWAAGIAVPNVPANPNPAKIINMSLGGGGSCGEIYQAAFSEAIAAGAIIVKSAGNANGDVAENAPANCEGNFLRVGSTDRVGGKSSFSNFAASTVPITISAPGGTGTGDENSEPDRSDQVLSLVDLGATRPTGDGYGFKAGTSMAAPHVAGILALMLSVNPSLTAAQAIDILQRTARAFPTGTGGDDCSRPRCGPGIVDAAAAVNAARGGSASASYQGLFEIPGESGHGVVITQQAQQLFVAWYHFDTQGRAQWSVALCTLSGTSCSGDAFIPSGSFFAQYDVARYQAGVSVGRIGVTMSDANNGSFTYNIGGAAGSKTLRRLAFGAGTAALATNYSGLWWGGSAQNGWGVTVSQDGGRLFGAWYTYDRDGRATWYVMPQGRFDGNAYAFDAFRVSGVRVLGVPFDASGISVGSAGTVRMVFTGNRAARWEYNIDGQTGAYDLSVLLGQ